MAAGDYRVVSLCPVCAAPIYGPRVAVPPAPGYGPAAPQALHTCECWLALRQRCQAEAALAWHRANAAAPETPPNVERAG